MASRVVRPETRTLHISNGDWLLVKKRLNVGEQRGAFARTVKEMQLGSRPMMDPEQLGLQKVVAYLVDWSLVGLDGNLIPIRERGADDVAAALKSIDPDSFNEILDAIDAHELQMEAERAAEKKQKDGACSEPAISPSPSVAAGALSGSGN